MQRLSCFFAIVERNGAGGQYLIGLVSFTGEDHGIAGLGLYDRFANRGGTIRLGEVATARDGTAEPSSAAIYNGRDAIGLLIKKSKGYSTSEVSREVLARVEAIRQTLPTGTKLDVVQNSGERVERSVENVNEALIEGAALTVLVVFLFLNSWRSTVITGLARLEGRAVAVLAGDSFHTGGAWTADACNKIIRFVDLVLQEMRHNVYGLAREYNELLKGGCPGQIHGFGFSIRTNNLKLSCSQRIVEIVGQALLICGISGYRNDSKFSLSRQLRDAYGAALMVNNDRITKLNATMLLAHREGN